jgi:hypothetical protein
MLVTPMAARATRIGCHTDVVTRSTGELIAHAFTPWEWRSRTSVVALVVLFGGWMIVGPVLVLTDDIAPLAMGFRIVVSDVILYFVGLRPALRSLRRWDDSHATRVAA